MIKRPITHNGDLNNLPAALRPLQELPQWLVWNWEQKDDGSWGKPPCQTYYPQQHASWATPRDWTTYVDAAAVAAAGKAEGITFVLSKNNNLSAIDVDSCRDPITGTIEPWARHLMSRAVDTGAYCEATPSGTGIRIWGSCDANAGKLYKQLPLKHSEGAQIELFRKTDKALTITGLDLNCGSGLPDISSLFNWCLDHGKRNKPPKPEQQPKEKPQPSQKTAAGTNGAAGAPPWGAEADEFAGLDLTDVMWIKGPLPLHGPPFKKDGISFDRSRAFAEVVGRLHGIGATTAEAIELLKKYPGGVAHRYLKERRLEEQVEEVWAKLDNLDAESEAADDADAAEEAAGEDAEAGSAADDDEGLFNAGQQQQQKKKQDPPAPLVFVKLSEWDFKVLPEREWAVYERLPLGAPALFSGPGGSGKSTLGLQLGAASVLGGEWLGTRLQAGRAICIDCEDDMHEMLRRLQDIRHYHGAKFADLDRCGLHVQSWAADSDTVLAVPARRGSRIVATPLFDRLRQAIGDIKPRITFLASSANMFAGNEIDRAQVQQFIKMLGSLCVLSNGTIILASHPSIRGLDTDTGLSGSTAWESGVRGRAYLKPVDTNNGPDPLRRELRFMKNQYAMLGEPVLLQYQKGLWLPPEPLKPEDKAETEAACDVFLLRRVTELLHLGTRLSPNVNAPKNYAPKMLALEKEAVEAGFAQDRLKDAMDRLLKAGKLSIATWARGGGKYLVVVTEGGGNG